MPTIVTSSPWVARTTAGRSFVVVRSDKVNLAQRRKGRQVRRNTKIFFLRAWCLGAIKAPARRDLA